MLTKEEIKNRLIYRHSQQLFDNLFSDVVERWIAALKEEYGPYTYDYFHSWIYEDTNCLALCLLVYYRNILQKTEEEKMILEIKFFNYEESRPIKLECAIQYEARHNRHGCEKSTLKTKGLLEPTKITSLIQDLFKESAMKTTRAILAPQH